MKTGLSRLGAGLLLALGTGTTSSCGGSSGSSSNPHYNTTGTVGDPSTALIANNLIYVNASLNGMSESSNDFGMLIDTGSPVVLLDPELFTEAPPATAADIQQSVDVGLLDATGDPVVVLEKIPALELSNAMMDALGFGGILGGNVMRQFSIQLDYSAPMMEGFCLGCGVDTTRTDVMSPGATIPFVLGGGGTGPVDIGTAMPTVTLPATRIQLTVDIEGTDHPFILDSGATEVSIRESVYDGLVADGRGQLMGLPIVTVQGDVSASVTRVKSLTLGGATVADPAVMTLPGDALLDSISSELGHTVDGLLGGDFLRNFLVTIDYPNRQLHLQPYLTPPIPDEFRRVGFTIQLDSTARNFVVGMVYAGTDAATQNIQVNDQVTAIDGTSLATVEYVVTADNLLDGTPGTTKTITFGRQTTDTTHENQTLTVMVDDLIPDPQ